MAEQAKNVMIGLLIITAAAILTFAFFFIHPYIGDSGKIIRARFTDIDKINVGTRVTFAGKPVGEVIDIIELKNIREQKRDRKGDVYAYELLLEIDSGINLYKTDEITIRTSGLLGEKSIAILPKPFVPGQPPVLITDQIVSAEPIGNVEDTLGDISALSEKLDKVLEEVFSALHQMNTENLWGKITHTVENVNEITTALNKPDAWEGMVDNVYKLTERLPKSWDVVDESLENILITTVNVKNISETGQSLMGDAKTLIIKVNEGQGSLGKIVVGTDLYLQLKSLLSKGSMLMDDVNNYGVLFQLNKKWQRLNARRLNLLCKLYNSNEFNRFFNCELEQVASSLARVSAILQEEGRQPCPRRILCNPEYTKGFSDLLQNIENIEESLNMYNQQMVDCAFPPCCP